MNVKGGLKNAIVEKENKEVKNTNAQLLLNEYLNKNGLRRRFDEVLGQRAPQFISSVVTLLNDTPALFDAFSQNPMNVVKGALKAAAYDLPLEPSFGLSYLIPFRNKKTGGYDVSFVVGYKGMVQLALRTGLYQRINTIEVREGELVSYDLLKEDIEFNWIEDEKERESAPITGYAAYYRLNNGMEKTLYMTKAQIEKHERVNRKGFSRSKIWEDEFDSMAKKTLLRLLLSKWGIMSINYLDASQSNKEFLKNVATGQLDDESVIIETENIHQEKSMESPDYEEIPMPGDLYTDPETGEVKKA